jgi:hypothetical protein
VRRRHDDARAELDAVARDQRPRRLGEHDPRPIVVGEDQRPLDRAGRQHDALGPHLPQTLARAARIGRGEVVGQPLLRADEILRVESERLRPWQQSHARRRGEFGQRRGEPHRRIGAVDARLGLG